MLSRTIIGIYKVFFVGLLLQFFLQTFVTFSLGIDYPRMEYVRLRKEGIIALLLVFVAGDILFSRKWKQLIKPSFIGRFTLALIVSIAGAYLIHTMILGEWLQTYIIAVKYDFLGFIILLAWFHASQRITPDDKHALLLRYGKVIQRTLVLALIWYFVIAIKPGTLKLFGYDNFVFEGDVGQRPPAAYYTHINRWFPRNQFLFERPISRWFFLTAFRPIFFMLFLYKKPLRETRWRRGVFGFNVLITFSRAARGSRIIELILMGRLLYARSLKKFVFTIILPVLFGMGVIGYLGYEQIFARDYSNNGHIDMIQQGLRMIAEQPLRWYGGAAAGPWSHREWWSAYNPENQFIQIIIEFGLIGFLGRFFLYVSLNVRWVLPFLKKNTAEDGFSDAQLLFAACSIGLIGLSASGMVLHSFSDRMSVYPFMLYMGIVLSALTHTVWTPWISVVEEDLRNDSKLV